MKFLIVLTLVLASTSVYAVNPTECQKTAAAGKYVAEQRDNGTPMLVTVFKARDRFDIRNEMALNNLVQSVYDWPQSDPSEIYTNIFEQCSQVLTAY